MRALRDSGIPWIGEIPVEWQVYPARYAFSEIRTKNTDGSITNALKFYNGTIIPKTNFDAESDDYVADTISNYTIVQPDTIMINGLNLNYDLKSLRVGLVKETGVITSAYLALWPDRDRILPCFATYLFKGYETKMAFHNMGAGIRKTLGFKEFKQQPILIPSLQEQQRVVDCLDEKCARIDAVMEQTRASIEEYKKMKQSIITEAVTKGIRPNRPMKDSGIDWIGQIPEEWTVSALGKGLSLLQTGPFGSQLHAEEYIEDGVFVINPANISNGSIAPDSSCSITEAKAAELSRHILQVGDIVFGRRGEMGRSACLQDSIHKYICGTGCLQIRCNDLLGSRYVSYYLQNPCVKQFLELHSVGTTMQNLNTTIVSSIPIVYGTVTEQKQIVEYIDSRIRDLDSLIEKKILFISELESCKKSLIFEYVTGKKEVL